MAIRTTKSKKPSVPVATVAPRQAMLWRLVLVVGVLVGGLTLLWRQLPTQPVYPVPETPLVQELNQGQRLTCERAGGKWTDCGNPCHGKDIESCVAMCEPQCLCGGAPKYSCPAKTVCTDLTSGAEGDTPIGVCRDSAKAAITKPVLAKITATVDSNAYPYRVSGTVVGTSTVIWWTALDESADIIGRGRISWSVTSTVAFNETMFLSAMPTSTALRFHFTAGSPEDKIEVTSTSIALSTMTRSIYKDDPNSTVCETLIKESVVLPKTILPFEATMRAALGDALIGFEVSQGVATIVVPPSAIFSDECAAKRIAAIAKAVTADFPSISSLVIQEQNSQTQP